MKIYIKLIMEYWKYVAFVAKYDLEENVMEICDKNKGIYDFHNILQCATEV